jgi:hypothetical protein
MAAPVGNKFAVGNNGGRPPTFETPEQLIKECEEYFTYIRGEKEIKKGKRKNEKTGEEEEFEYEDWVRYPEPATVTGLTLYIGFSDRSSLDDYEKKEEFSHIIKKARKLVEYGYEMRLHGDKNTGAIFALKNMGWKDKQELEHTGDMNINWNEQKTYAPQPEANTGA